MPIESVAVPNRARFVIGAALALSVSAFFLFVPPIAQDETYHFFADNHTVWGIPNFWNVLLTFLGSSYYHLAPSDARLVWDRLPMTLVFMALLACVVTGESDSRHSRLLLATLVTCGIASVLWWSVTSDLRFYVLVQFGPLLILVPALWFVRDARYLAAMATYFIYRWRLAAVR